MANSWFTADTHFGHDNILNFQHNTRGQFKTIEEHDERIIQDWNRLVRPEDTVYHLGDVGIGSSNHSISVVRRLSGKKILVGGNHDKKLMRRPEFVKLFDEVHNFLEVQVGEHWIHMFHYPIWEWGSIHYGSFHLHGHVHAKPTGIPGKILDVGIDNHPEFRLFSYDEVVRFMAKRPTRTHK